MKSLLVALSVAAVAALSVLPAAAQPVREAKSLLLDLSTPKLISSEDAKALVREMVPARVWALYPEGRWTFLTQVEGGVTPGGVCVVTARVVLLPRTATVRAVMWRPEQVATTFDAKPGATPDECKAVARTKLQEAITAVVSALVKT
jgi:hypothetical protein